MIPKSLKIQNFLSHDTSEIDFDKFNVALILGTYGDESDQSNGAGKSAIFESITWALFGKSRHKKVDGVVKWNRRACRVEFTFFVEDELYRIVRTRDKIIRDSDVIFEQWDGTKFNNITCDTNSATDRKIILIINVNYEVFVNSVYFKQDDISMFATATPSKRKDVLKALLKMGKWDAYQKKAKEKLKVLETKIEEKSQNLVPLVELNKGLAKCKLGVAVTKKQIKENNTEYAKINTDLISKKSQYQTIYGNTDNVSTKLKKLQLELLNMKKRSKEIKEHRKENDKTIKQNTGNIAKLQQKISEYSDQIKNKDEQDISALQSRIVVGKTKKNLLSETITNLKREIKLAGKCDICKHPLTKHEIGNIKKNRKEELIKNQSSYNKICSRLTNADKSLKNMESIVKTGNKAELDRGKAQIKISKSQNEINSCMASDTILINENKLLFTQDIEKEISNLKLKSNKNKEEELLIEIENTDNELKEVKKKGDRLNVEYGSRIRKRNELSNLQKTQAGLQKEIDKLNSEYSIYHKLRSYFGREGIQSIIIENVIEELENYSNETLARICNEPTSISIKTQKQNDNGSWSETFDIFVKAGSRTDDFDTFSGGEKFRISLALRLALSNILSRRMGGVLKFLLLDEVSSNLDNNGLDMFIDIVKHLSDELKILVITHNERLKERFEDIIMVNKGPNGSKVSFQ